MLVLTRKLGQSIVIVAHGQEIRVTVAEIASRVGRVRLGIEAPEDVRIARTDAKRKS